MTLSQIGPYIIESEISRNDRATIYLAVDPDSGQDVVVKVVAADIAQNPAFYSYFEQAVKKFAQLKHLAIVSLRDFNVTDGRLYAVMDYLRGGSLAERLKKGPLSLPEISRILDRLAPALDAAHARGIIHRNLQPSNILFDENNKPYLSDFSFLPPNDNLLIVTHQTPTGTPAYMSPEQIQGNTGMDGRTDVYALGAILFEMLTGRTPYQANTTAGMMRRHAYDPIPDVHPLRADLPAGSQAVINQALAKNQHARYSTAAVLAAAVRDLLPPVEEATEQPSPHIFKDHATAEPFPVTSPVVPVTLSAAPLLNPDTDQQPAAAQPPATRPTSEILPPLTVTLIIVGVIAGLVLVFCVMLSTVLFLAPSPDQPGAAPLPQQATLAVFSSNATPVMAEIAATQTAESAQPPIQPLVELARFGQGTIRDMALSPDGKTLAVAGSLGVRLYDSQTLLFQAVIETDRTLSVAWSPDGRQLAIGGQRPDYGVYIWDLDQERRTLTLSGHEDDILSLAWSPNALYLASGDDDGVVFIWDISASHSIQQLDTETNAVRSVAWTPDGRQLAVATGWRDYAVQIWDPLAGHQLQALAGHRLAITQVAWSADGRLASSGEDNTVRLWDLAGEQEAHSLESHLSVAWSATGAQYATADSQGTIHIWDTAANLEVDTLSGHSDEILGLAWFPDDTRLISWGADGSIRSWDTASGQETSVLTGYTSSIYGSFNDVAWSPDSAQLASAGWDRTIEIWHVAEQVPIDSLEGYRSYIHAVAWSPDGTKLASGGLDRHNEIRLWDLTAAQQHSLPGHDRSVGSVAWSPDGTQLASASDDSTVRVWDVATSSLLVTWTGHEGTVTDVSWSPDGRRLASGSQDNRVRVWNLDEQQPNIILAGHRSSVTAVAWSPDGAHIASASEDGSVRLWDADSGEEMAVFLNNAISLSTVAWSPDGRYLATAGFNQTIWLWDVDEKRLIYEGVGHTAHVRAVAWSPDGAFLASGSDDGTMRIWRIGE